LAAADPEHIAYRTILDRPCSSASTIRDEQNDANHEQHRRYNPNSPRVIGYPAFSHNPDKNRNNRCDAEKPRKATMRVPFQRSASKASTPPDEEQSDIPTEKRAHRGKRPKMENDIEFEVADALKRKERMEHNEMPRARNRKKLRRGLYDTIHNDNTHHMIPTLLIIPLIVGIITQGLKIVWRLSSEPFSIRRIHYYGGMPSAHTAMTTSLLAVLGFSEGFDSPAFAVAAVFGILVVRDAIGFRRTIGKQSRALNALMRRQPQPSRDEQHRPFHENLGHTPLEAFMGALIGFCISSVLYLAFS
jgi:acid phosphatase family membrane protein YuiD